jgi:hypothetical protein
MRKRCGGAPERDTLHNEFIMRRFPVVSLSNHSGAFPNGLASAKGGGPLFKIERKQ